MRIYIFNFEGVFNTSHNFTSLNRGGDEIRFHDYYSGVQ
jgi:hypothetical protein